MKEYPKKRGCSSQKDELEQFIQEALEWKAGTLKPDSLDAERMCARVRSRIKEDGTMTRMWSLKKITAAAVIACALGTITAVAAGKVTHSVSHTDTRDEVKEFSQVAGLMDQVGFSSKVPEAFSNGYAFSGALPSYTQGMDEEENVVAEAKSLDVTYSRSGISDVELMIEKNPVYSDPLQADQTLEHNGVTLNYICDEYLFVPPDYQVSEEDLAKEAAGELYIGYGSPEVEHKEAKQLQWNDGEISYLLMSFDNTMTSEEFAQMAGEIIDMTW